MRRKIMRRLGNEFCQLEIELRDGRLSICGASGHIVKERDAKREALEHWESFFEEQPEERLAMGTRFGRRFRTPRSAARFVLDSDGQYHGVDVVCERDGDVYIGTSFGQIREEIESYFPEAVPYLKWHLNDLRPECAHQEARGESYATHPDAECFDNGCARDVEDGHGRTTRVGYKVGSAWLKRELPADVIAWAETFSADEAEAHHA